jgi:hypothetical protein
MRNGTQLAANTLTSNLPPSLQSTPSSINAIAKDVSNILFFLVGAVAVGAIIYGGLLYALSGGDQGRLESAKNTILYAVVGLVVAILSYAIVAFVIGALA